MSSSFGNSLKISLFGQSHSRAVGVVIDGLPAGEAIDLAQVSAFMARRAPGNSPLSTARKEADVPDILSGLLDGKTCGAPLCATIQNSDRRSGDYAGLLTLPRPGHADFPAAIKHDFSNDIRGGGHFSARLTAPLCFAGALALQLLARRGIFVGAHIAGIKDTPFDPMISDKDALHAPGLKSFCVCDDAAGEAMQAAILAAKAEGDSVGGIVECAVIGLPVGLGEPLFDGVENRLAAALFAIPALKGLEFGAGFEAARMKGSQNNDAYTLQGGRVQSASNHHGGILGGLSSGMPIVLRAAFKPTPSIAVAQQSVNLTQMAEETLAITGRHDPCVVPRAVPCVEAACALALLDLLYS